MNTVELQQKTFLLLLVFVTVAFGWILLPFYGAVFWGSVLAIIFTPFHRRLLAVMNQRQNLAALTTLLLCLIIVILPVTIMTISLLQEGAIVYQGIRSGELNFGAYFQQIMGAMPPWVTNVLDRLGLTNISELQDMLSTGALQGSQFIAMHALSIGQNAFEFVISFGIMLYLLFFLLRDGAALSIRIKQAMPLSMEHKRHLFSKFTTVIRATVKGNVVVAAAQGTLGGIMFSFLGIQGALLWGFVMAFLSLLPAVGAGLIWVPVAVYFLFTGAIWQGVTLIAFGVLVIGLVDNILRPILVGRDTKIPDYVILISTLGGMVLFGLNGFVIGPVIAALFIAAWDLFSSSKEAPTD
ncbi:AI-2E family transporter [Nitrosospira sp. Nsp1]|uniref:AI-2E family transporter n=1 Tax=Nitrosospira sp. Nsp1 TaxID=136547 RepID=UPI00088991E6|nr:AI-2E family transporter [Nitrosospira sp. Nsp1]SCX44203.1 Predicted PurR-regulated permease PerM [Nitrosospira sp. Nsp1]